jgi:hypothetical protein
MKTLTLIGVSVMAIMVPFVAQGSTLWNYASSSMICGSVVDEYGHAVPGATVSIKGDSLIKEEVAITDLQGYYWLPVIPAYDEYCIKVSAPGYGPTVRCHIVLFPFTRLDLYFQISGGNADYFYSSTSMIDYSQTGGGIIVINDPKVANARISSR